MEILVVDDSNIARRLTCQLLRSLGHAPDAASSGAEAIAMAEAKHYHLVFMDLHMPAMDGMETMEELFRRLKKKGWVPPAVIALTAENAESERRKCLERGMAGFLTKPCRRQEMATLIETCKTKEEVPLHWRALPAAEGDWTQEAFLRPANLDALRRLPGETTSGLLVEMVRAMEKETPESGRQIAVALRGRKWGVVREILHKLIGNFEVIGSPRLAAFCRACSGLAKEAETGKRGAAAALRRLWANFANEFAALRDALRREI